MTDSPASDPALALDRCAAELQDALDAFDALRHDEALACLVRAEELLDMAGDAIDDRSHVDTLRVAIWRARGEICTDLGDYDNAISWLRRALGHARPTEALTRIDTVGVLNALGMASKYSGRYDDAAEAYEQALELLGEIDLSESDDGGAEGIGDRDLDEVRAVVLHNVGGNAHANGRYDLAELATAEALELHRELDGDGSYSVASDSAALAAILHATGRSDEAETLLRDAIEAFDATVGRRHRDTASALHNLGDALAARGAHDEARDSYAEAIRLRREMFGAGHPDLAMSLNNLAVLEAECGRDDVAAELLAEAAMIVSTTLDPSHMLATSIETNMAAVAERLAG